MITPRPYAGPEDLARMQALVQTAHRQARHSTLHTGDVAHRIFNGLRDYDPAAVVWLWEGDGGALLGWTIVWPPFGGFDSLVHPDFAAGPLAEAIITHAEARVREWLAREGVTGGPVETDLFENDPARAGALLACGFQTGAPAAVYTVRPLANPLPPPRLPDGFTLRPVAGPEDAERMVELRRGSFGSAWTVETYRALLRSPGYDPQRELIIVAPDGRFAAHCTLWLDAANRIGLFEPVGTHADFRRLGLGRALLLAGLARMRAAGMTEAVVWHLAENDAARALYTGLGFAPHHRVFSYSKP